MQIHVINHRLHRHYIALLYYRVRLLERCMCVFHGTLVMRHSFSSDNTDVGSDIWENELCLGRSDTIFHSFSFKVCQSLITPIRTIYRNLYMALRIVMDWWKPETLWCRYPSFYLTHSNYARDTWQKTKDSPGPIEHAMRTKQSPRRCTYLYIFTKSLLLFLICQTYPIPKQYNLQTFQQCVRAKFGSIYQHQRLRVTDNCFFVSLQANPSEYFTCCSFTVTKNN